MSARNRGGIRVRLGRLAIAVALGIAAVEGHAAEPATSAARSPGVADWKKEFEALCSRTQDAMTLEDEELRSLVERCDRLKPALDALAEPERKAYSRRLAACRNLYAYVLESRGSR